MTILILLLMLLLLIFLILIFILLLLFFATSRLVCGNTRRKTLQLTQVPPGRDCINP
jgi:hypothetical protein